MRACLIMKRTRCLCRPCRSQQPTYQSAQRMVAAGQEAPAMSGGCWAVTSQLCGRQLHIRCWPQRSWQQARLRPNHLQHSSGQPEKWWADSMQPSVSTSAWQQQAQQAQCSRPGRPSGLPRSLTHHPARHSCCPSSHSRHRHLLHRRSHPTGRTASVHKRRAALN